MSLSIPSTHNCYEWNNAKNSFVQKSMILESDDADMRAEFLSNGSAFVTNSQAQQDVIVMDITNGKNNGYFVDLAASQQIIGEFLAIVSVLKFTIHGREFASKPIQSIWSVCFRTGDAKYLLILSLK